MQIEVKNHAAMQSFSFCEKLQTKIKFNPVTQVKYTPWVIAAYLH